MKTGVKSVPGEVSVGTAAINVGPAKQICCEHVSFHAIYIHRKHEVLAQVDVPVCWDYLIQEVFKIMETTRDQYFSKRLWHIEQIFFFQKNAFLLQGFNNTQSSCEKGAHLSLRLTRTSIGEVASDPHAWIWVLEQGAEAGFSLNFVSFAVERQSWQAQALPVLCGSQHMNLFYKCARDTLIQQLDHFQKTQSWISELTSNSLLLLSSKIKNSASRHQVMNAALSDIPWKCSHLQMDKMKYINKLKYPNPSSKEGHTPPVAFGIWGCSQVLGVCAGFWWDNVAEVSFGSGKRRNVCGKDGRGNRRKEKTGKTENLFSILADFLHGRTFLALFGFFVIKKILILVYHDT